MIITKDKTVEQTGWMGISARIEFSDHMILISQSINKENLRLPGIFTKHLLRDYNSPNPHSRSEVKKKMIITPILQRRD